MIQTDKPLKMAIIGHSRGGTAYVHRALHAMGVNVGHETMGKHGSVCWIWGHKNGSRPERKTPTRPPNDQLSHMWHVTRDPLASIPSITTDTERAWQIRMDPLPKLRAIVEDRTLHPHVKALASWAFWHAACRASLEEAKREGVMTWQFQIEDPIWLQTAADTLKRQKGRNIHRLGTTINSAKRGWGNPNNWVFKVSSLGGLDLKKRPTWDEMRRYSPEIVYKLAREEARTFGYEVP